MKHLPIISGENVSRNFKKYIRSALHRVPAPIISALAEDGWQIQLSPKAETLFAPSSRVAASFASASGTSHKRLRGATCMSGEHVVAFFESYIDDSGIIQQGPGSWITEDQIVHEIGHAIDRKTGEDTGTSLSDSPDFIAAYHRDLAGLNNRERIHFNYFIAKKKATSHRINMPAGKLWLKDSHNCCWAGRKMSPQIITARFYCHGWRERRKIVSDPFGKRFRIAWQRWKMNYRPAGLPRRHRARKHCLSLLNGVQRDAHFGKFNLRAQINLIHHGRKARIGNTVAVRCHNIGNINHMPHR